MTGSGEDRGRGAGPRGGGGRCAGGVADAGRGGVEIVVDAAGERCISRAGSGVLGVQT